MPKRVSPKGMRDFAKELILRTRDNPPEPDNLRHILFYNNEAAIMRWLENQGIDMEDYDRTHKKNFANAFYSTLSSVLSKMVLDGNITYAELNITEEERIKDDATEPEHKVGILFEKQGLHNALKPIKAGLNISLWSCKGFNSTNALEQLTSRLASNPWSKMFIISDFDPSGLEIAADLERRCRRLGIRGTKFIRIGINPEDIPEERRAMSLVQLKVADSRTKQFIAQHGRRAYQVEALSQRELRELVLRKLQEHGFDVAVSVRRRHDENQRYLSRYVTEQLLYTLKNSVRRSALEKVRAYDTREPTTEELVASILDGEEFLGVPEDLVQSVSDEVRAEFHITDEDEDGDE